MIGNALDGPVRAEVRTDYQLSPHEGPTGILAASRAMRTAGGRTAILAMPPSWTTEAKCLDDWKAFAPAGERQEVSPKVAEALCAGCPVLDMCRESAMEEEGVLQAAFRGGIRGGLTPLQRYKLAKRRLRENPPPPPPPVPQQVCRVVADHVRVHKSGRWRCLECEAIRSRQLKTCTCGRTLRVASFYTHRSREGCR